MRFKKHRRHRKTVKFFTTCFGFRQPFKVLCDGTFVHHLLANGILPADQAVSDLLGGPVKLFTTKCVLAELKRLGRSHFKSFEAASNLMIACCEHEKVKAADACVMEVVGETNTEHFFVATQDYDLRKKFQKTPGVPVLFGLRNALFLDSVSEAQREFVKELENKRSHVTEWERSLLQKRTKSIAASKEEEDSSGDEQEESEEKNSPSSPVVRKKHPKRKGTERKDGVQFKRKIAKGPNPLSCKKKNKPGNKNPTPSKQNEDGGANTIRSRSKRKRSRKPKQAVQVEN